MSSGRSNASLIGFLRARWPNWWDVIDVGPIYPAPRIRIKPSWDAPHSEVSALLRCRKELESYGARDFDQKDAEVLVLHRRAIRVLLDAEAYDFLNLIPELAKRHSGGELSADALPPDWEARLAAQAAMRRARRGQPPKHPRRNDSIVESYRFLSEGHVKSRIKEAGTNTDTALDIAGEWHGTQEGRVKQLLAQANKPPKNWMPDKGYLYSRHHPDFEPFFGWAASQLKKSVLS